MSFGQEHHFLKIGRSATNGISVRSNGSIYRLHGSTSGGILLSYSQDFPRKQDYRFSASEGNWRLNGGCRRNPSGTGKACYTLHSGGGSVDGHFIDIE
jgi:hypothetical protein